MLINFWKVYKFPSRKTTISTPQLNALLRLHLEPINLIIFQES